MSGCIYVSSHISNKDLLMIFLLFEHEDAQVKMALHSPVIRSTTEMMLVRTQYVSNCTKQRMTSVDGVTVLELQH